MECFKRHFALFACAAMICGLTGTSLGYSRKSVSISSPGSLQTIGQSSSTYDFRSSAAGIGVGALNTSTTGYTGNVLQSSLKRSGLAYSTGQNALAGTSPLKSSLTSAYSSSNIQRPAGNRTIGAISSGSTITASPIKPSQTINYSAVSGYSIPTVDDKYTNATAGILREGIVDISTADSYLAAIGADISAEKFRQNQIISSFAAETVENEENPFNEYIKSGESFFRDEEFIRAFEEFEYAKDLNSTSPEAWLSMAQARFANSVYDYPLAGYYLQQALINFPELPLVNLRPKGFYSINSTYLQHMERLESYIATNEFDSNGYLLSAYFKWFTDNPDAEEVKNLLQKASDNSIDNQLTEAVNIFWDGIAASGKASGKLSPPPVKTEAPATSQTTEEK